MFGKRQLPPPPILNANRWSPHTQHLHHQDDIHQMSRVSERRDLSRHLLVMRS